jgi:alkanesulfonate monooxygenase SsuD/methylene tetrahydromethanopterin reductase-like flavin-dependent oxidoreductase (luciferase family)
MKYGFVLPWGDAATAAELAVVAEQHGWDGFFCWEGVWAIDAWVSLTAAAMRTTHIRLGTMLTPLPRRRPWDVASQAATLDRLSGGRVILSVGLGASDDRWWIFEADPGARTRAQLLDESLDLLPLLWREEPFSYAGVHYQARPASGLIPPAPLQRPHIPIWVVGLWPSMRSMHRCARWDGWLPNFRTDAQAAAGRTTSEPEPSSGPVEAQRLAEAVAWIRDERSRLGLPMAGYDIVVEGRSKPGRAGATPVRALADAGATWWLEADWTLPPDQVAEVSRERLRAGPPDLA